MKIIDKTGIMVDLNSLPSGGLYKDHESGDIWIRTDCESAETIWCVCLNNGFCADNRKDYFVEPLDGELKVWGIYNK